MLNLLPQLGEPVYGSLFVLPLSLLSCELVPKLCQLLLQILQAILA